MPPDDSIDKRLDQLVSELEILVGITISAMRAVASMATAFEKVSQNFNELIEIEKANQRELNN